MKITEKIAIARKHTGGGKVIIAVNDMLDILEVLAQPIQINGYERLVAERDTYKALVEKCIQAQPEPDTTESFTVLNDHIQGLRYEIYGLKLDAADRIATIEKYQEAQNGYIERAEAAEKKLELAESKAANEFLLHQDARDKTRTAERRAEKAEKEIAELRELFHKFYHIAIKSDGKSEIADALLLDNPQMGDAVIAALGLEQPE